MGQKVNPIGFRLGINRTWEFALVCGTGIRRPAARGSAHPRLPDEAARPGECQPHRDRAPGEEGPNQYPTRRARGVVIGKKGADIERLKTELQKLTSSDLHINIMEIRKPEIAAQLVAENIAQQLVRRVAFRRAMKRAVQSAMRLGAQGIRINCGGRLGGAEIARTEWYREGRVPLHTLRADIDYGHVTAHTAYGTCGVKVWVFKGEILAHDPMAQDKKAQEQASVR